LKNPFPQILRIRFHVASLLGNALPLLGKHSSPCLFFSSLHFLLSVKTSANRCKLLLGSFISDEANEAAKVKQNYPVMVVIGNPPYSYESANTGSWISSLVRDYYQVDGKPLGERNPKGLQDDYVKFIRFAQWRIEQTGYGILAFISNHGYLDNPTFRGMRQSLLQSFDDIYVLDLHGNSKKKERSPDGSKDENVFDIQQGVVIGIFVKRKTKADTSHTATVRHAHLWGPREVYEKKMGPTQRLVDGKYYWLAENELATTEWTILEPLSPFYLFVPQNADLRAEYSGLWKLSELVLLNSVGIATSRDNLTIHYSSQELMNTVRRFGSLSKEEAREEFSLGSDTRDWQVHLAQEDVNQQPISGEYVKKILYRPFDFRYTYYTGRTRGFISMPRYELIRHMLYANLAICVGRQGQAIGSDKWDLIFCGKLMEDYNLYRRGNNACFPLYLYPDLKKDALFDTNPTSTAPGNRRPNLSPAFITDISNKLNMQFIPDGKGDLQQTFGPEDIFNYMYAVFHSPTYRARYVEFLKIDFPRLPLTSNTDLFRELCSLGERLVGLHLVEKFGKALPKYPAKGNNLVEKVEYLEPKNQGDSAEQGRVYINKTQYFEGVPPEVWNFHVGGYQVCHKWLKDRKGRVLSFEDIQHYQRIVAALAETIELMEQVDEVIEAHGGWPVE
jgi:predicted helicase